MLIYSIDRLKNVQMHCNGFRVDLVLLAHSCTIILCSLSCHCAQRTWNPQRNLFEGKRYTRASDCWLWLGPVSTIQDVHFHFIKINYNNTLLELPWYTFNKVYNLCWVLLVGQDLSSEHIQKHCIIACISMSSSILA